MRVTVCAECLLPVFGRSGRRVGVLGCIGGRARLPSVSAGRKGSLDQPWRGQSALSRSFRAGTLRGVVLGLPNRSLRQGRRWLKTVDPRSRREFGRRQTRWDLATLTVLVAPAILRRFPAPDRFAPRIRSVVQVHSHEVSDALTVRRHSDCTLYTLTMHSLVEQSVNTRGPPAELWHLSCGITPPDAASSTGWPAMEVSREDAVISEDSASFVDLSGNPGVAHLIFWTWRRQ